MPNWRELTREIETAPSAHDTVRQKYLEELSEHTGRYTIVYYSGWLQHPDIASNNPQGFSVSDSDQNAFMANIHGMTDRERGLDLLLHTPGGDSAATESLVDYLHQMFGSNIRAIVPQLAMSAGTMIACACKSIVMGKHSSLGPIDPQIYGLPAHAIVEEFEAARSDIAKDPNLALFWQPIIANYPLALASESQRAIDWSRGMARSWLMEVMFKDMPDNEARAQRVIDYLGDHDKTATHARHVSAQAAKSHGLLIEDLEADQTCQDLVLSVHHACIQTISWGNVFKMVANNLGAAIYSNFRS